MSKNIYTSFIAQFCCWMLFFQIARLAFVAWNYSEFSQFPIPELLRLPFQALYVDAAMGCYFMVIPWLLFTLALFLEKKIFFQINKYFTAMLIVMVSCLTIGELPLYDEWHTKLNHRAIQFLGTPSEVFKSATPAQLGWGILGIVLLSCVGVFLFNKWVPKPVQSSRRPWAQSILFALVTPGLIVIGMRGGLQEIPIQVSDAYYSKHNILNLAATNSCFHLMSSIIHNSNVDKPYQFMPDETADSLFSEMHKTSEDSLTHVLTTPTPNIVLVILEGWSGDVVKSCGGYEGISPNFENLIKDGYFFNNCYASGERSDQGMVAIFSAFPSQPKTTIIRQPNKYEHLPCMLSEFKKQGYASSFLFGGQLSYGNIKAYTYFNGFDRITEGKDFDGSVPRGKLTVADEYLYDRQLEDLSREKQPFFAAMFTGSTHSPYEVPGRDTLSWGGKEQKYLRSAIYADKCIHEFIEKARQTGWYQNTLFVFVSDHSHPSPKAWQLLQPESRKIPFLLYGPVLKPDYRGKMDTTVASQLDLASTLLGQLGMETKQFPYSKNLFNPSSPRHAFYCFDEGICMVKPTGQLCWHVKDQHIDTEKTISEAERKEMVRHGQAFLQTLMKAYLNF